MSGVLESDDIVTSDIFNITNNMKTTNTIDAFHIHNILTSQYLLSDKYLYKFQ